MKLKIAFVMGLVLGALAPTPVSADNTAEIQNMLTRSDYVVLSPKTYWVCDLHIDSNKTITGTSGATVIRSSCPYRSDKNLFDIRGSLGSSYPVATIDKDVITIENPNTGIVPEEVIYLNEGSSWAEYHKVQAIEIVGNTTTLRLHAMVDFPFTIATTVVQRGTWKKNINISNITFEGAPIASKRTTERYEDHHIGVMMAHDITVRDCKFHYANSRAIIFIYFTANSKMLNNISYSAYDRNFETHTRTSNCQMVGNIAIGGLYGISCQGIGTICNSNRATGQHGFDANNTEHGGALYLASTFNAQFANNSGSASWDVCLNVANAYQSIITGNMISGCTDHGIGISSSNNLLISNNHISRWGNSNNDAAIHLWGGNSHLLINSNRVEFPTTDGIARRFLSDEGVGQAFITVGLNSMHGSEFKEINLTPQPEDLQTERLAIGSPLTINDGDSYRYTGADWVPGRMEVWGLAKAKGQLFTQTAAPTLLNGECTMALTSDTNVKVTCKGSDATIRNADITIAP